MTWLRSRPQTNSSRLRLRLCGRRAAEYDLTLDSTFTGLIAYSTNMLLDPREDIRTLWWHWFRRVLRFTSAAGARFTGGHVGAFTASDWADPHLRDTRWRELKAILNALAAEAKRLELQGIYIESMAAAREPSTTSQLEELLEPGDEERVPLLLCLDLGHQCVPHTSGEERDPYAWLQHFRSRLGCIHLQQSDAANDHHWPFTDHFNALGRIDPARVLETLDTNDAQPTKLFLEIVPPFEQDDETVLADLVESVRCWQTAMTAPRKHGLETNDDRR